MGTRVIGLVPPEGEWQRMADVCFACKAAGVDVPTVYVAAAVRAVREDVTVPGEYDPQDGASVVKDQRQV